MLIFAHLCYPWRTLRLIFSNRKERRGRGEYAKG